MASPSAVVAPTAVNCALPSATASSRGHGFPSGSSVNCRARSSPPLRTFVGLKALESGRGRSSPAGKPMEMRLRMAGARAAAISLPIVTFDGTTSGNAEMNLKTARPETAGAVVHRGVITELQNRRRGTASTLTRAEVRGGGRKPYKQKGTGQARRGSQRTPLRPGGGVVFGPKPVDWRIKINRKEKQLAISTAIQSAAVDAVVIEDLEEKLVTPKTKDFLSAMRRWGADPTKPSLIFTKEIPKELDLSARNVKTVKILTPRSLNLYDILRADKLLFTTSGLQYLNDMYGSGGEDFDMEMLDDADAVDVDAEPAVSEDAEPSATEETQ